MADWPTSISNFGADAVNGDTILPDHINKLRAELIALEKSVAANDSGTLDPANINDSVAQASYDATILVNAINRVGGVLDVLASQVKKITGKTTWKTLPRTDLETLGGLTYVTLANETAANKAPSSLALSNLIKSGTYAARPAIGSTYAGTIYFATDVGFLYLAYSGTWIPIGFYPQGAPGKDALVTYDGNKYVPLNPPVGNTYLQHNNTGYVWGGLPANYQILQSPTVYDPPTKAFGFYNTVQLAINAATSGQVVLLPPGTYTENLTFNTNSVTVSEVINNTVTISGTVTVAANVTGCKLNVATLSLTNLAGVTPLNLITINGSADLEVNTELLSIRGDASAVLNLVYVPGANSSIKINTNYVGMLGTPSGTLRHIYITGATCNDCFYNVRVVSSTNVATFLSFTEQICNIASGRLFIAGGGTFTNISNGVASPKYDLIKPTFVKSGTGVIYVRNVYYPVGTLLPTALAAMNTGDRISQQDAQALAGTIYAGNNFI